MFMQAKHILEQERKRFQHQMFNRFKKYCYSTLSLLSSLLQWMIAFQCRYLDQDKDMFDKIPDHHGAKSLAKDFLKIRKTLGMILTSIGCS